MTSRPSPLAHIGPMVSNGEENLATEALCFILNQSAAARRGFIEELARVIGRSLPDLVFYTQAADSDGTIPDLVGRDSSGRAAFYVESKFWAGLTDSQPVGYLRRLQRESGLGLVVLAPANRLVTLWPELVHRCRAAEIDVEIQPEAEYFRLTSTSVPPFGLTSWSAVLAGLLHATSTAGDATASEDLRQLKGLCDRMEEAGFLPLRAEELTSNLPHRIENYCGLADDLTSALVASGLANTDRLKATGGRLSYRRYVRLLGNGGAIAYSSEWWAKVYPTPMWLWLRDPDWKTSVNVREALAPLFMRRPPAAFIDNDAVLVPLLLRTASERHVVLASLVEQVKVVCDLLPTMRGNLAPLPDGMNQETPSLTSVRGVLQKQRWD